MRAGGLCLRARAAATHSMPAMPGTACSLSHLPRLWTWFQWHESVEYSDTSSAVMWIWLDSKKTVLESASEAESVGTRSRSRSSGRQRLAAAGSSVRHL